VITSLKINEGLDSFHSLAVDGSAYTGEFYYDYHAVVPFLVGDGARPDPLRVLSLGDAAGTFNRLFAHAHPGCTVDAVELDAAVVQLGDEYFGGRTASGRVFAGLDARVFVERSHEQYDVILVDAYERQVYIPAHVASVEFFTAVKARLAEAGVVSVNVGGLDFDDPVVRGLGSTMAEVFGNSHGFHIPYSRNFMLVARKAAPLDPTVLGRVRVADPQLQEILNRTAAAHGWRSFSAADGGHVLRDDRPVLDELLDRSGYGAGSVSITQIAGDRDPVEVGTEVRDLLGAANPRGAIATLSEAQRATAFLRILAGDARWSMGNLRGAMAEYRAAQDIPGDPVQGDLETYLNTQLAALGEALASRDKAISIATRNGWLAALLSAALAAAALIAVRRS
jgi:spermidine synthase